MPLLTHVLQCWRCGLDLYNSHSNLLAVQARTEIHMQVVGEKLSFHVLANYEEFVRGVNEVASIEKDLQVCALF